MSIIEHRDFKASNIVIHVGYYSYFKRLKPHLSVECGPEGGVGTGVPQPKIRTVFHMKPNLRVINQKAVGRSEILSRFALEPNLVCPSCTYAILEHRYRRKKILNGRINCTWSDSFKPFYVFPGDRFLNLHLFLKIKSYLVKIKSYICGNKL